MATADKSTGRPQDSAYETDLEKVLYDPAFQKGAVCFYKDGEPAKNIPDASAEEIIDFLEGEDDDLKIDHSSWKRVTWPFYRKGEVISGGRKIVIEYRFSPGAIRNHRQEIRENPL